MCYIKLHDGLATDTRIYQTHSAKKGHSSSTFEDLFNTVHQDLNALRTKYHLGEQFSALMVIDRVLSDDKNELNKVVGRSFGAKMFEWSKGPL